MITWTESYEMGIRDVDDQHRSLVKKINELHAAMKGGRGREQLAEVLEFLGRYAVEHFDTEEALMRKHCYPGYEAHKQEHTKFKADFGDLSSKLMTNPQDFRLVVLVQQKLSDWLTDHLKKVDRDTMSFLVKQGCR